MFIGVGTQFSSFRRELLTVSLFKLHNLSQSSRTQPLIQALVIYLWFSRLFLNIYNIQLQMSILVFLSLSLISVAALYYLFFLRAKPQQNENKEEEQVKKDQDEPQIVRGGNRMAQRVRNRRRAANEEESDEDNLAAAGEVNDNQEEILADQKLSKKEMAKMQKRQEKERVREAIKQQREEQERRRAEQEAKEEEEENKRREEELAEEERIRKRKEEEEQKEKEEYNKWKDMFQVEAAGDKEEEDSEFENKLQLFIDYIILRKVVTFEDLAAEFKLSSKDVIDRIQRLMESGRLVGITDDRGKFIHLTQQECESISCYIKSRGRVSKGDLQLECNKLVRLQPRAEDKVKIKQEQKSLLEKVEKEFEEPRA